MRQLRAQLAVAAQNFFLKSHPAFFQTNVKLGATLGKLGFKLCLIDAAALYKMADRRQITGGILDGPLAFDNAVSAESAKTKGIVSPVAGQADIFVVPDLEAGNMLAKQLEYLAEAEFAGIVLGARVPIILTSRADTTQARLGSCAIALLPARHQAEPKT